MMKPTWQHTCEKCRFLGGIFMPEGLVDWYVCGTTDRTILARYSDEEGDYWSKDTRYIGAGHHTTIGWDTGVQAYAGMNILAEFMLKQGEVNE